MDSLIVATFKQADGAEDARRVLLKECGEKRVAPEEAVVVMVDENGGVRLNHTTRLTMPTALSGGFVGILAGLLIFNPALALVGGITGTALGAILGALKEVGIDPDFMRGVGAELRPGASALFVRGRAKDLEEAARVLAPLSGNVHRTSLAHADEKRLEEALGKAQQASGG